MPKATPQIKVEGTKRFGASVVLEGGSFEDAHAHALALRDEKGLMFVHPFDDPDVIAGQGTIALEMIEDAPNLEILIVPIGGGGLVAGVAVAAKALNPAIRIVGVQVSAFPCYRARKTGEPMPALPAQTIAEGIAVKHIGSLTYHLLDPHVETVIEVTEDEVKAAIARYREHGMVVEGAGAASLAALLKSPEIFRGKHCGLIVSGANIDSAKLDEIVAAGAPALAARTARFARKDQGRRKLEWSFGRSSAGRVSRVPPYRDQVPRDGAPPTH
jgi:threonine dehydratase